MSSRRHQTLPPDDRASPLRGEFPAAWAAHLLGYLAGGLKSSPAPGDRSHRADWTTARSRVAAGHPEGTRSALDADGGQVAARQAGNRPVRVRPLRATHLYRRENGEWKIVHRHADHPGPIRARPAKHRRSKVHGPLVRARSAPHREPLVPRGHPTATVDESEPQVIGRPPLPPRTAKQPGAGFEPLGCRRASGGWQTPLGVRPRWLPELKPGRWPKAGITLETGNALGATATTVGGLLAICWQQATQQGPRKVFVLVGVTGIEPVTSAV
jgi:hypothetical protein